MQSSQGHLIENATDGLSGLEKMLDHLMWPFSSTANTRMTANSQMTLQFLRAYQSPRIWCVGIVNDVENIFMAITVFIQTQIHNVFYECNIAFIKLFCVFGTMDK